MPTFRLTLEYDGAGFQGWQAQRAGQRTVQGTLESAIARVTGERARVRGAGRTDAGVHAAGQLASLRLERELAPWRLRAALNGVLPPDVAVREVRPVPDDYDARRAARSKRYEYALWNGAVRSPLRAARVLCLQRPLDLDAMRVAAAALEGTHDFASFQAVGSNVRTSIRTLLRVEVAGEAGAEVSLGFEGTGFLRHMVRNLVGTLLQIGSGRRDPRGIDALLAARDRRQAGPTAPPHALTLIWVRDDPAPDCRRAGDAAATGVSAARSDP